MVVQNKNKTLFGLQLHRQISLRDLSMKVATTTTEKTTTKTYNKEATFMLKINESCNIN